MGGSSDYPMMDFPAEAELFFVVLLAVISLAFSMFHTVGLIQDKSHLSASKIAGHVRQLKIDILLFNYCAAFLLVPALLFTAIYDVDRDQTACHAGQFISVLSYKFIDIFLHRVLLDKVLLIDVHSQAKSAHRITWWLTHGIFLPFGAFGMYQLEFQTRTDLTGEPVCYQQFTIKWFLIVYFCLHGIVSNLCLALFQFLLQPALPSDGGLPTTSAVVIQPESMDGDEATRRWWMVLRNLLLGGLSIMSTAGNLAFTIYLVYEKDGILANVMGSTMAMDMLLNVIFLNMTWDVRYYMKILGRSPDSVSASDKTSRLREKGLGNSGKESKRPWVKTASSDSGSKKTKLFSESNEKRSFITLKSSTDTTGTKDTAGTNSLDDSKRY